MIVNTLIMYDKNISISIDRLANFDIMIRKHEFNHLYAADGKLEWETIQYIMYHNTTEYQKIDETHYYRIVYYNGLSKLTYIGRLNNVVKIGK